MGLLHDIHPAPSKVVCLADYRTPSIQRVAAQRRQQPMDAPGAWSRMAQARAAALAHPEPSARLTAAAPAVGLVRVTHFADAAAAHGTVRRLRICGRLADVCAELERLAAAEERQTALPRRA
ncbi:MAG: hypothetical protein R3E52_16995 [Burkholderiaceae bacterium]